MSKSKKIKIIVSIVSISFIQGLQFCISPVLGQIQEHYPEISINLVQMLVTAPALLAMAVAIVSGWLVVKISKKKLLVFGSLTAGILGFLPFLSDSFWLLFVSRALFGIAQGLATALNTAVVADFFEGDERVSVMGIQAASVGAGMVVVTTMSGILGAGGFKNAYFINIIGFISMILIVLCLPDTGKAKVTKAEGIHLTKEVYVVSVIGMLEGLFLITFSTNIAMHLSGNIAGSSMVSGTLAGIFSGSQIVVGIILRIITKYTKKYTLPVAMLSFGIGGIFLVLFSDNFAMLIFAAFFCGISQGMFIPTAMVDVANAVTPVSTAMASACLTCTMCFGQLVSPIILNNAAERILGEFNTTNLYIVATVGIIFSAGAVAIWKKKNKEHV